MKKPGFLCATLCFLISFCFPAAMLQAQGCYVQKDEVSGFDVTPYLPALDAKACELAALFDSAGFAGQFKVFSFGFYAGMEHYDGYSYPQAFLDMKEQVAQESPYFLLIGRQSDHRGVFTRFWVGVEMPDTGIFSCATEEQKEALKTRLLVAIEYNYFKNGKIAAEYDQAEMNGMVVLKEHLISLFDCCNPQNRETGTCDDCLSFDSYKEILSHFGYQHVTVNNLIATPKDLNDGVFNEKAEVYFTENDSISNLNSLMKVYLDSLNEHFNPIKADILLYGALTCVEVINKIGQPLTDELAKISIVITSDNSDQQQVFMKSIFKKLGNGPKKVIVVMCNSGLNNSVFKTHLTNFIKIGGCNPNVFVTNKLISPDYAKNDFLIVVGSNNRDYLYMLSSTGQYCELVNPTTGLEDFKSWWKLKKGDGISDITWHNGKVALVDAYSINIEKLRTNNKEEATAFVVYHELAHLTLLLGHTGGVLASKRCVETILGTSNYDGCEFNIYSNLFDLITDPDNKYGNSSIKNYPKYICQKLKNE